MGGKNGMVCLTLLKLTHVKSMRSLWIQEMEGSKPPMDHIHPSPRQNTRKGTNNSSQPRGSKGDMWRHVGSWEMMGRWCREIYGDMPISSDIMI
jgi:hypothetical protein